MTSTYLLFHKISILCLVTVFLTSVSCTRTVIYLDQEPGTGEYLSGHPLGNTAPHLEEMLRSVKRITSTTYYETYLFDEHTRIMPSDIDTVVSIESLASVVVENHTSSSGTAIVIHNRNNRVGMITARHVITSPDTLYEYRQEGQPYLQSVTIKKSQINWLFDAPFIGNFEVLADDAVADLAVIGTRVDPDELDQSVRKQFPVFPYPFGRPDKLQTGTFTYNLGYPRGYPMVTTGIVSKTYRDRDHSFVTDALFNPGFSGGAVVAVNGGIPAFEWVGLARSTSASREWFVVPDEGDVSEYIAQRPYHGDLFLDQKALIHYGITHVISSSRIKNVLSENADHLMTHGYNIVPLIRDRDRTMDPPVAK